MARNVFSSKGYFAGLILAGVAFLAVQMYASYELRNRTVAFIVRVAANPSDTLPPGVLGVGERSDDQIRVVRGILPKLDPRELDDLVTRTDAGTVLSYRSWVVYCSSDGIAADFLSFFRMQVTVSIMFFLVLIWLAVMFYYMLFRTVQQLGGWVQGHSRKKAAREKRISGRQLPMHGFTRIVSGIEKIYSDLINTEKEVARKTKLEALGVLFAKVLHDIKNSLASVKIYLYLMKSTTDESRRRELAGKVEDGMQEISVLIQDLLDFVRGNRGSLKEQMRVKDLYNGLKTEYTERARVDDVAFDISLDPAVGEQTIYVDMVRVVTALKHLVNNAFEEVVKAEVPNPRVEIRLTGKGNSLVVEISDNGRGIPEDIRDKVFLPFISDGKEEGSGIGTAVAKEYVDANDGAVSFETSEQGTAFRVTIPFSTTGKQ